MTEVVMAALTDISGFAAVGQTLTGTSATIITPGIYYINQSGAFTATLPVPGLLTINNFFIFKDFAGQAATKNITITTGGLSVIDGASTITINTNYGVAFLSWNGANFSRFV